MTAPNIRRVYAVRDSNIGPGGPKQRTGSSNNSVSNYNAFAIGAALYLTTEFLQILQIPLEYQL